MKRSAAIVAAFAIGGLVALLLYRTAGPPSAALNVALPHHPLWIETKWPFPMDQWGEGRAFHCNAIDCGVELALYIRSKIGFCSATTGVVDDDELERLSDFDLMGGTTAARGAGHEIKVAWMKGRLRTYAIAGPGRAQTAAMSIAYNNDSDALVATIILDDAQASGVEPTVIEFLNGKPMLNWVKATLGL
jgi:hypothetical protein